MIAQRCVLDTNLPDTIIAATALQLNLPLMTRNVEDFERVPNLELLNPFEPPREEPGLED